MINRLKLFLSNRINLGLVVVLFLIIAGGVFGVNKLTQNAKVSAPLEEVSLAFDAEGPYAILEPRRDGNSLILNIKRVGAYDAISYELAYQSEGIDRGVSGNLETANKKSEYSQEILFGTCSQGFTFGSAHCVFDKNVENGTLVLKIQKRQKIYRMETLWHLQKPDVELGVITSGDGHFIYRSTASREELAGVAFSIVNDLTGVPKLPVEKQIIGKVYAFNLPTAKTIAKGEVIIELSDKPQTDAKLARFVEGKNDWEFLDTKTDGNRLSALADGAGIFAVLVPTKI